MTPQLLIPAALRVYKTPGYSDVQRRIITRANMRANTIADANLDGRGNRAKRRQGITPEYRGPGCAWYRYPLRTHCRAQFVTYPT